MHVLNSQEPITPYQRFTALATHWSANPKSFSTALQSLSSLARRSSSRLTESAVWMNVDFRD